MTTSITASPAATTRASEVERGPAADRNPGRPNRPSEKMPNKTSIQPAALSFSTNAKPATRLTNDSNQIQALRRSRM